MVLKLSEKVHYFPFCADFSKKPKSVKPIYIYASESSYYTLSEIDMVYRYLSHRSWDIIAIKISIKDVDSAEI